MAPRMSTSEGTEQLIAGRYVLEESLGKGGMGVVWRAEDRLLRRKVAIKEVRLPAGVADDQMQAAADRVMREARAAASLNHPNAVGVYDVLEEEGRSFIVMEMIDGPTLADVIAEQPMTPRRAAEVGLEILGALEAAHEQGIVHRDVKPANVMVDPNGTMKLADFGIVSVKGDPRLTASGMILGSPSYMAPEQAREGNASPATDLWALGATLYFAVEGKSPFDRNQAIPTLTAVLSEEPDFSSRSGELRPVIEACLRKDPEERPSEQRLREMLRAVAQSDAPTAAAVAPTRPETRPVTQPEPAPVRQREVRPRRNVGAWVAALVALLLVGGAIAFALANNNETPQERAGNVEQQGDGGGGGKEKQDDTEAPSGEVSVPDGWTLYENPDTGYTIAHPEGWEIQTGNGTAQSVDFVDPETGAYMRVDWKSPPGPSAQGAWEDYEPSFADQNAGYERIEMTETTFQGYEASHWEYTYGQDSKMHAVNLGFIAGDYGFALNYQAPESSWDGLLDTFETFRETFAAPSN